MTARTVADWLRILQACGVRSATAIRWAPVFADTIKDGMFSAGDKDLADFLPTILHESANLESMKELGNYSADRIRELAAKSAPGTRWRSLGARADELAHNEARFFEACYGGRMGNGPEGSGDGAKYPGRTPIGITGKDNYIWLGDLVGQDLVGLPELAEQPHFALEFCIKWWEGKVPDSKLGDTRAVRKVVNGGYFGLADVEALAAKARAALA
jgi:putative chitinase